MEPLLTEYWDRLIGPLFDPQKRIFVGYLLSAVCIAVAVSVLFHRLPLRSAFKTVFSPGVWFAPSAMADYKILLINKLVMMGIAPRLITQLAVATLLFEGLHLWFNGRMALWPFVPGWAIALGFTATLFLLDDATKYLVHRALHRWPALWAFHQVHHSAEVLTPLTVYRTHPVEAVLFSLRSVLVQAAVMAVFLFFFSDRTELVAVLGANVFLFFFNVAGANLRHSHVWISYGAAIERWLISPAQHQIHHSVEERHYDRNFGAVLAVWDRLGGSLCLARNNEPSGFGLGIEHQTPHSLRTLYIKPFALSGGQLVNGANRAIELMIKILTPTSRRWPLFGLLAALMVMAMARPASAAELNIYSHRQPFLIKPFLDAYEAKTGTKINVVYASKGLAQRLQAEGKRSPADVILTVDIARLNLYADKDLLAVVNSDVLKERIPAHLRDPDNRWFAFSKRARVIAAAKRAGDTSEIKTYADLADPKWKGRICVRPGSHVYNRALVASLIHASGEEQTEKWARGLFENLARRPQGNDRAQVKAIYEGVCDIALINNYYFGKLEASDKPEQREWAKAVRLIFPNQDGRGTHVNISGGGVAKHAPHRDEAVKFLEFLTSEEAQKLYGKINYEYPVNPSVEPSPALKAHGKFKEDQMPIARISELAPDAQKVIDRVGW